MTTFPLQIGDTVKSDDDNSVEEDEDQENDYNDDLAHHCWSFLSQKPKASCTSQKQQMTETKEVRVEDVTRMETTMVCLVFFLDLSGVFINKNHSFGHRQVFLFLERVWSALGVEF